MEEVRDEALSRSTAQAFVRKGRRNSRKPKQNTLQLCFPFISAAFTAAKLRPAQQMHWRRRRRMTVELANLLDRVCRAQDGTEE